MILAIDGYEANVTHRVGIGRYAYELLIHMHQVLSKGQCGITVRIYLPHAPITDMPKETQWWQYRVAAPSKFWTFVGFPWALATTSPRADVIFSPTHYIPRFISTPRVMAIMDLSYLEYPDLFRTKDLFQLVHWTKYSATLAKKIFTISEFSKRAILKAYGGSPDRVVVTYPGLSPVVSTRRMMSVAKLRDRYGISKHYIFSVGTVQPRKNYVRLIEAFSLFLAKNKQQFGDIDLVIVGKKGWLYEEIYAAPKTFGVQDRVKFLDFISDADLSGLYKHALCFALPSLYEGFGLPVLEAMAYGCPVVVSNTSSLPEIAGKAGIYVDPLSVENIAKGLLSAVRERNLMQGRARIKTGLARVELFSWEKAAEQALTAFEELGKGEST